MNNKNPSFVLDLRRVLGGGASKTISRFCTHIPWCNYAGDYVGFCARKVGSDRQSSTTSATAQDTARRTRGSASPSMEQAD
uniref:Uncharacterized protein n=1 Tax=Desulfomonile tiedjei TaxID=2358 RepID=A0A7C4AQ63_9BACT